MLFEHPNIIVNYIINIQVSKFFTRYREYNEYVQNHKTFFIKVSRADELRWLQGFDELTFKISFPESFLSA